MRLARGSQLAVIAACLLLPLPIVFSLWGMKGSGTPIQQGERPVSPVLPLETRRALLTFERLCQRAADCESPLGCLQFPSGKSLCVASECETDLQCPPGLTCRLIPTQGGSPLVRYCVVAGTVKEGEPCSVNPAKPEWACMRGLLCSGYCGRPCSLDDPSGCPEGFYCRDGMSGPSCHPTCEGRTCPDGERCVRYSDGDSVCGKVAGEDCQQTPCPRGQECSIGYTPGEPGRIKMKCITRCGASNPPCPQGAFCYYGACRRACEPERPDACGTREVCVFYPGIKRWLCDLRD